MMAGDLPTDNDDQMFVDEHEPEPSKSKRAYTRQAWHCLSHKETEARAMFRDFFSRSLSLPLYLSLSVTLCLSLSLSLSVSLSLSLTYIYLYLSTSRRSSYGQQRPESTACARQSRNGKTSKLRIGWLLSGSKETRETPPEFCWKRTLIRCFGCTLFNLVGKPKPYTVQAEF